MTNRIHTPGSSSISTVIITAAALLSLALAPARAQGIAPPRPVTALYELSNFSVDNVALYLDRFTHLVASRDANKHWRIDALVATTGFGDDARVDEIIDGRHLPEMLAGSPDSIPSRFLLKAVEAGALRRVRSASVEQAVQKQGIVSPAVRFEPLHEILDTINLEQLIVFRIGGDASKRMGDVKSAQEDKFLATMQKYDARMNRRVPELIEAMRYYTKPGRSRTSGPLSQLIEDEALDSHDVALCDSMYDLALFWGRAGSETTDDHFILLSWDNDQLRLAGLAIVDAYGTAHEAVRRVLVDADAEAYLKRFGIDEGIGEYIESINQHLGAAGVNPVEVGLYRRQELIDGKLLTTYLNRNEAPGEHGEGDDGSGDDGGGE